MDTNITDAAPQDLVPVLLQLKSVAPKGIVGAPILTLTLNLTVAPELTKGVAVVTQALAEPIVCRSNVIGPVIDLTLIDPVTIGIRIDLTGTASLIPSTSEVFQPVNFRATVWLKSDYSAGVVEYQYGDVGLAMVIEQEIFRVD